MAREKKPTPEEQAARAAAELRLRKRLENRVRRAQDAMHVVARCPRCVANTLSPGNVAVEERRRSVGITPGSGLAQMLEKLPGHRAERRMLLSVVQGAATPRRARLSRRLSARLGALGLA